MRQAALALTLILLGSTPSVGQGDTLATAWQHLASQLPPDPTRAARMINNSYAGRGVPLTFWVRSTVPDSALRGLTVADHPCGTTAFTLAPRLPPKDQRLEGERMAEVDAHGRELRVWPVPVDHWPRAINGDELLLNFPAGDRQDLALAVKPDGRYPIVPLIDAPSSEHVDCPPYRGFGTSAYTRCVRWQTRIVVYQGPCT